LIRRIRKKTLRKIVRKRHNFVAQVKNNQSELLKWIRFNAHVSDPVDEAHFYDHNEHGGHEQRIIRVYDDLYQIDKEWSSVKRFITIESIVATSEKVTRETRYYISSLDTDAQTFATIIRHHWRIENALHYVKDVAFQEDFSRMRTHQTPRVASLLRSLAINLLTFNKFDNKTQARKLLAWGSVDIFRLHGI
jgi:predicted transposase YbfD/YdcC